MKASCSQPTGGFQDDLQNPDRVGDRVADTDETAYANDDDKRTDKQASATFKAMDANRDDRLTVNEVSGDPTLAQNFTAMDRDADGYLSKKEYSAAAGKEPMKDQKEHRPY